MNEVINSFKVLDIVDQEDGTALVYFDLGEDFIKWFCEYQGVENFDKEIFQEWFLKAVENSLKMPLTE